MKICMVLQKDFPPDIRVENEASALIAAGHTVHLLCRNQARMNPAETVKGIQVHRLVPFSSNKKINSLCTVPLFFNPLWCAHLNRVVREHAIQVIHVHDLPLVPLGLFIGRRYKIPLVYDMHENYPAALKVWRRPNMIYWTIKNPALAGVLDKFCQQQADQIIVVVAEQRQNLIEQGIPPQKITVISNTADLTQLTRLPIDPAIIQRYQNDFVMAYIGGFSPDRDLNIPIEGIPALIDEIPYIRLLLVGSGDARYTTELKRLVHRLNLEKWVEFVNWVPFEKIASYMTAAKVGIIPQPNNLFINTTIPHKLFQYMAFGLPVVVSDAKPLARVVNEGHCGVIFKSGSAADFARAILEIKKSTINFGENGKKLVRERYNWAKTATDLVHLYQRIEGGI